MTEMFEGHEAVDGEIGEVAVVADEAGEVAAPGDERGMTTAEYAVGVVLVITLVTIVIKALQAGWFAALIKTLIGVIFKAITGAL